ncbi:MAG: hypothetical protein AAF916_08375 [Planctomycetota bacterium]
MSDLTAMMQDASERLVEMAYLACEAACLEALAVARAQGDWRLYARIVMPLQEARRQRRMIAADAVVQLGSAEGYEPVAAGCVVLTHPDHEERALATLDAARRDGGHVEVLFADNPADAARWTLRSFEGPEVSVEIDAPLEALRNAPLHPDETNGTGVTPRHWFVAASEALGDAALSRVDAVLGSVERVEQLETFITACGDHELLHQALFDAAHAVAKAQTTSASQVLA